MTRIVKVVPSNPLLVSGYMIMAPLITLVLVWNLIGTSILLGGRFLWAILLASLLFFMSPWLSFYNIVIWEREELVRVLDVKHVIFMGIPIPVPSVSLGVRKQVIAINVGGALIPIIVSFILLAIAYSIYPKSIETFLISFIVVALVTYMSSKVVPGVGIMVPGFIPPLTAGTVTILLLGVGPVAGFVAYASGSLGSLFGADVLRLLKDLDKLGSPFLSIGGVGVFDGVFLSGAISFLLVL